MWLLESSYKKNVIRQLTKKCLDFNAKLDAMNTGELSDTDKQIFEQTKQYTSNALKLLELALKDKLIRDNLFKQFQHSGFLWDICPDHWERSCDPVLRVLNIPVRNLLMRIELYILKHRLLFTKDKQDREQIEKLLCRYDIEYKFASLLQSDEYCVQKILEVSMNLNKNKAQLISGDLIKLWEQAPSGDMSAKAGIQAFLIIATMFSIFALTMTILTAGISIGLLAVSFSLGVFCMINVYLKEENQIKNARSLHQLATTVPTPDETAKQSIFKLSASFFKPSGETTIANDTSNVYHSEYSQVL